MVNSPPAGTDPRPAGAVFFQHKDCPMNVSSNTFDYSHESFFVNRRTPLVLTLVFVVTFLAITFTRTAPQAGATPTQEQAAAQQVASYRIHTVQHGESYWSIATDLAPKQDPRPLVSQLIETNGSALQVGQEIILPVR